jgi:hypothetical protein
MKEVDDSKGKNTLEKNPSSITLPKNEYSLDIDPLLSSSFNFRTNLQDTGSKSLLLNNLKVPFY